MASVVHPNIATIHGIEWWLSSPILVVEYLEGGTLAKRLAQGPLPIADAVRTGRLLALALEYLHVAGLLHRDVKPSNIAYTRQADTPKLLDFGLATLMGSDLPEAAEVSSSAAGATTQIPFAGGAVAGTPLYLPPEAFEGAEAGPAWDVWALAMTLYEAIAGQHPFAASTLTGAVRRVRDGSVPDLRTYRPDCPAEVAGTLSVALRREAGTRLSTAVALWRRLDTCATGTGL
jgi:serine/threonine protein kinase